MPKHWYAVQTKPRQEHIAEQHLQNQAYTTYLPKIRHRKLKQGRWEEVTEPLFPRYLFIHCDPYTDNTAPVRSTRGVTSLVRIGRELRPVPDEIVAFLKQAGSTATGSRHNDAWPHQPGDEVTVLKGHFAGINGVFKSQNGEERALVLLDILGRTNQVEFEIHNLA